MTASQYNILAVVALIGTILNWLIFWNAGIIRLLFFPIFLALAIIAWRGTRKTTGHGGWLNLPTVILAIPGILFLLLYALFHSNSSGGIIPFL